MKTKTEPIDLTLLEEITDAVKGLTSEPEFPTMNDTGKAWLEQLSEKGRELNCVAGILGNGDDGASFRGLLICAGCADKTEFAKACMAVASLDLNLDNPADLRKGIEAVKALAPGLWRS